MQKTYSKTTKAPKIAPSPEETVTSADLLDEDGRNGDADGNTTVPDFATHPQSTLPGVNLPAAAIPSPKFRDPGFTSPLSLPPPMSTTTDRSLITMMSVTIQIVLDLSLTTLAFWVAFYLRGTSYLLSEQTTPLNQYLVMMGVLGLCLITTFKSYNLYRFKIGTSYIDLFYKLVAAITVSITIAIAFNSLIYLRDFIYSRAVLVYAWALSIVLITVGRIAYIWISGKLRQFGLGRERMLILGTGHSAKTLFEQVTRSPELGYSIAGFIDVNDNENAIEELISKNKVQILGKLNDLTAVLRHYQVDEMMIALDRSSHNQLLDILALCEDIPVSIKIYPDTFQLIATNQLSIGDFGGLPIIEIKDVSLQQANRFLKRTLDIAVSLTVLIFSSWFLLLVALLVKLTSPGPVFFVQERVGLDGHRIKVLKFRSMRMDAQPLNNGWTVRDDPRRTGFGAFIRRFSIDELPQFINVLTGEMSVVGPRPEQPQWVRQFAETVPRYMRRHREKAGITGWAQINGLRGDTSIEERTRYDLYYIENWSLLFDLKIIFKTFLIIFRDKNAY